MERAHILASYSVVRLYSRRRTFIAVYRPISARTLNFAAMRHISSSPDSATGPLNRSKKGFGSSFATKVFVATATASASYAAYYCATIVLFSSITSVNGDDSVGETDGKEGIFKEEKKIDDKYGIEYTGFDTYPGVHLDDGTGVSSQEFKAASVEVVSKALDAAGLDESIVHFAPNGGDTLHPNHPHRIGLGTCPLYGCPFLPLDVHYEEKVKDQLQNMRKESSSDEEDKSGSEKHMLKSSGSESAATLTLIGYKGGKLEQQINQDRALALSPFLYWNINSSSSDGESKSDSTGTRPVSRLIGAFDGHANFGEKVSEYVVKTLPSLLGKKLAEYDSSQVNNNIDQQQKDRDIGKLLHDTFLELDATSPADPSGGCTASVVLQLGTKLYVANAGDSRSFIVVHVNPPAEASENNENDKAITSIIYGTREDKPHLSTERDRVEHMGGTVYLPNGFLDTGKGTTRVLYKDPTTGSTSGLAMSRSIGDWDAGAVGVIPDPLVDILDIKEIKTRVLQKLNEACEHEEVEIDASGETSPNKSKCLTYKEENVKVFAIAATDVSKVVFLHLHVRIILTLKPVNFCFVSYCPGFIGLFAGSQCR